MSNDRRDAGGYMGWFLFGAVVGAGVALLMTPKTGASRSATGTPTRTGGSAGEPEVIIRPLSAWMMLSMAFPDPFVFVAPKPEIEQ